MWTAIALTVLISFLALYLRDRLQTSEPVARRFPVLVWGRKTLVALGPLLRQYLFLNDEEETPFDRITRNWIYRTARGQVNTVGFGAQNRHEQVGSVAFLPATFTNKANADELEVGTAYRRIIGGRDGVTPVPMRGFVYISGMSFGALSSRAIQALNKGAERAGIFHNTGEGSLAPPHEQGGSLILQIGTAKFGVRDEHGNLDREALAERAAHPQVKLVEIKLAQGAKPGKGGMLLKEKVTPEIAKIRRVPMGQDVFSPPRHKEFDDTEGLFRFIKEVREIAQRPVGIKMVIGKPEEFESIAKLMSERPGDGPDFITIDGSEGGSGAAPLVLAANAGMPLVNAIALAHTTLEQYGVRDSVALFAAGKIATPARAALIMALGADAVGIARGFMFALGCIQALDCHTGHCPTGIATQNPRLERSLDVEAAADRVATYAKTLMKETLMLANSCGYDDPSELTSADVMTMIEPGKLISYEELLKRKS